MAPKFTDSYLAFRALEEILSECSDEFIRERLRSPDEELKKSINCFEQEFCFLSTFLGYTQVWSDAYEVVPSLGCLVIKVAAAVKSIRKELQRCSYLVTDPSRWGDLLPYWWKKTQYCFAGGESKLSSLLRSFAKLNEEIELLKPEIRDAFNSTNLSSHSFQSRPPSTLLYFDNSRGWSRFCVSIRRSMQFLSLQTFSGPLKEQMKDLEEKLQSLGKFIYKNYFHSYFQWYFNDLYRKRNHLLSYYGGVFIRIAHMCCLCWTVKMDTNMEKYISIFLSDLRQQIDLASPKFLEMVLGTLEHCEAEVGESIDFRQKYKDYFVQHMLGVQKQTVLHDELMSLINCAIKIPNMLNKDVQRFELDIKTVLMEAVYLKNKDYTACKIDLAILFARIWFLKVEIFVKEQHQNSNSRLMLSIEDQIKALHVGSGFLIRYFNSPEEREKEKKKKENSPEKKTENQILMVIKEVPRQVESFCESFDAEEFAGNKVRDVLYKFLVQVMLFKAKTLLLELLNSNEGLTATLKHQIGTLHEGLIFVIASDIFQPKENTENEKLILTYIEAVAAGVISLCNSFLADEITEEAVKDMELLPFELLAMVQILKAKLKELYLQVPRLNFPKTPGLHFIEFLLQKLRQLLSDKLDSVAYVTHQIEAIHGDLEFLILFFRDVVEQGSENHEQKDICKRLIYMAYEAEYVIDSFVVGNAAKCHHLLWLYHVSEEIRLIKIQLKDFHENKSIDIQTHNVPLNLRPLTSLASSQSIYEDVVVLNDEQQVIIDQLTRGSLHRDFVSIVGMPGIGKTTLANNVYNDPEVICYFHIRAWCCVSQVYRKRDLLLDILRHIIELTDSMFAMSNDDLELVLYKHLKKNRYLIFMDDMWNIGVLNDLQSSFPDDGNGSRILITSRLRDVASKFTLASNILDLRPLSCDESWELLKMKIFHEEGCPQELLEVGKEIAGNCKGLPLSVVAIAGILNRTNKKPDSWKRIAESLNSLIVGDQQTRCMDILELSYKQLPDYLRACFLYFGAFQEDKEIPVWRLTLLWMAEGFIQKKDSKSLEDLAEDYLMDLIGRSLVIVAKRRSNGGVKACRVHDMVRNLCLLKAKEENFLEFITSDDEPYASFDDSADLDEFNPSNSMTYEEHRLCICASRKHFIMSRPSGLCVRSLLFFATTDTYPRCPHDISFISENFKLLKVLDLECVNMGHSFAEGIQLLVCLSYLAVGGDIDSIPSSLANLRNLETFLVKGLKGRVILPDSIWRMTRLRHLHVDNHAILTLSSEMSGSSYQLDNLISLSSPSLSNGEHAQEVIKRLPNLRKLRCILSKSGDYSENFQRFPRFKDLTQLESLRILFRGKTLNMGEFNFPSSLKKLTLSNFCLRWDHISAIGRLGHLEVLKLLSVALEDTRWEMREGEFPELMFLKLDSINIVEWSASSSDLPNLRHLVLRKCKELKEIPFDFMDIVTLKIIEVQQCGVSVEDSARRLKEEQLGYGIDDLKQLAAVDEAWLKEGTDLGIAELAPHKRITKVSQKNEGARV